MLFRNQRKILPIENFFYYFSLQIDCLHCFDVIKYENKKTESQKKVSKDNFWKMFNFLECRKENHILLHLKAVLIIIESEHASVQVL